MPELQSDDGRIRGAGMSEDLLYICSECSTVTFEEVEECPACGNAEKPLTLAFTLG